MTSHARLAFALWLILACSVGSPAPCAADAPVALRGDIELRHATVKLGDLFSGVPAGTDRDIAQAPPPGKPAIYDANLLAQLAKKYQLDWAPQGGADHVTITSACTRITPDDIRQAVIRKIRDAGAEGEIEAAFDSRLAEIDLPADRSPDFDLGNFDYDSLGKRFHADLVAEGAGGPFSLPLTGHVLIKRRVPVLAHKLEGNTIIGAADIDWIEVPEERLGGTAVTEASEIVGHALRHAAAGGELLHTNEVMPPRLVTRGALVTMKIEAPGMVVTAQGKALQDGVQGETVRILNTQSNRMIEGTVGGPDTVVVTTAQKLAEVQ